MKKFPVVCLFLVALANSVCAEPIHLDCALDDGREMSISYDKAENQIGLFTATEVFKMPFITADGKIVLAFWVTPDVQQLQSLSFHTDSGAIQIARVGTKEPFSVMGQCQRRS